MDIRLQHLSYSGLLNLHACPRRYQLDRLNAEKQNILEDIDSSITFAYGHTVGYGLQLAYEGKSEEEILCQLFLQWEPDLFASNPRQGKSFGVLYKQFNHSSPLKQMDSSKIGN